MVIQSTASFAYNKYVNFSIVKDFHKACFGQFSAYGLRQFPALRRSPLPLLIKFDAKDLSAPILGCVYLPHLHMIVPILLIKFYDKDLSAPILGCALFLSS